MEALCAGRAYALRRAGDDDYAASVTEVDVFGHDASVVSVVFLASVVIARHCTAARDAFDVKCE